MSNRRGTVRIGPISLFTLVIVLCLAVMAVLSFSTARAQNAITQRQVTATAESYANEVAAQTFVSKVDAILAPTRGASAEAAKARIAQDVATLADQAVAATGEDAMTSSASMEGSVVTAQFAGPSGRTLSIEIAVQEDSTYKVTSWKATSVWNEDNAGETLWTGK